jgi:hypothetical protein
MRRCVSLTSLVPAFVALTVAGCGGTPPENQVHDTVLEFSHAVGAHDYDKLCKDILAPKLVASLDQIGLPCEIALQRGLGDVKDPRLVIGAITVHGNTASAQVRSSAVGQPPSEDRLELVKVSGRWRIAELGGGSLPAPSVTVTATATATPAG